MSMFVSENVLSFTSKNDSVNFRGAITLQLYWVRITLFVHATAKLL